MARNLVTLRNFFRFAQMQESNSDRSFDQSGIAKDSQVAARVFAAGRSRKAFAAAGQQDRPGLAGPRHARSSVFHGPARFRVDQFARQRPGQQSRLRAVHRQGRQGAAWCRSGKRRCPWSTNICAKVAPELLGKAQTGVYAVSEPPWKGLSRVGVWKILVGVRAESGIARSADAAHVAPQFCDAPCSNAERICVPCNSCWDTRTSPPRRFIRTWSKSG